MASLHDFSEFNTPKSLSSKVVDWRGCYLDQDTQEKNETNGERPEDHAHQQYKKGHEFKGRRPFQEEMKIQKENNNSKSKQNKVQEQQPGSIYNPLRLRGDDIPSTYRLNWNDSKSKGTDENCQHGHEGGNYDKEGHRCPGHRNVDQKPVPFLRRSSRLLKYVLKMVDHKQ